jgi:hypothetical protein
MPALQLGPSVTVDEDRLCGSTAWLARLLWLFSYERRVTVDRRRRHVSIETTWLWLWRSVRVIDFDRINRIICTGQSLPTLQIWRYLLDSSAGGDTAFFLIALGLKDDPDEIELFTIWEQQPHERTWADALAGAPKSQALVGDEAAVNLVDLLKEYLAVPIARH